MRNDGLGSWPHRRSRLTPHATAIRYQDTALTYSDLDQRTTALAHALQRHGLGTGDRVAYLGPNHPALLETLFAAGQLGAILVPLNTRLSPTEIAHILNHSGTRALIYAPETTDTARTALQATPSITTTIALTDPHPGELDYDALITTPHTGRLDTPVTHDDVCMIMYTSGTTGHPKGAMITHGNVTWNCLNVLIEVDVHSDDTTLISAPLFHAAALNMTCLPTLLKGGTAVIMPRFTPEAAFTAIHEHRVTWMFGVPAMFAAMANHPQWPHADLTSVRTLECGGAPVPEHLITTYADRGLTFLQGYGMTETSPGALFLGADAAQRTGSAGKPSFFTDVQLRRPDGSPPATGEPGEVVVQGPNVMKGYWADPEATRAHVRDGWFHSGDVARVDSDGFHYIVDRYKDMYISGGENVYPAEIERVLTAHPDVADCAVLGVPDPAWGEVGKAYVVAHRDSDPTPDDLTAFLTQRLARYKVPRHYTRIDEIPRNAAGKAQKHRLPNH
ncbi:o-succinylbenzoate--CoA ligase [Spiractinospora alimapuensis]|uniref:o-succinylbenzoate--CoA ligase n=1 Tax=Spiractinospora alimapuensis TaxID=2820884 RepID=UPI001EEB4316|nr:o-succinylbenzoate--CoA ligase [Spiractinospora alimapuensis]QVQ52856.1 o-succinylbenzoate--CoA ligase [Spiractinospora alimapuensis]